jgi:hypothetical protein
VPSIRPDGLALGEEGGHPLPGHRHHPVRGDNLARVGVGQSLCHVDLPVKSLLPEAEDGAAELRDLLRQVGHGGIQLGDRDDPIHQPVRQRLLGGDELPRWKASRGPSCGPPPG